MTESQSQLISQIEQLLENNDRVALQGLLQDSRSSDIAEVVELVDNDHRRMIFDALDKTISAEVLEKVDEAARNELFELLADTELAKLVSELPADDAADVLGEMDADQSEEVLDNLAPADAAQIKSLMKYSEDSAGGIMDPVLISVRQDTTVAEAVAKIRAAEIDEDFFSIFVTDANNRFLGIVRIRLLLTANENRTIGDLLEEDAIFVTVDADQEAVRNLFRKNDLIVVPVLNKQHKLVGRITADRVLEVAEEEAAEDIYTIAGTDTAELESESVLRAGRIRMTWLLPCLIGTGVTALLTMVFRDIFMQSDQLPVFIAAVVFVPMIAAMSGNAGLQTSAIVISGLAAGHLADLRLGEVFQREIRIAVIVAFSCGLIGAAACAILPNLLDTAVIDWAQQLRIVLAFGVGMFSAIMVATTLGLFLPFLFRKIGIDPAISAGPLVTTANDSISVAIYMILTLSLV